MSGEHDQVVFHSRRVIGECEPQLELVGETEARDGRVGHEGRVAELIAAAESGAGYVDGCKNKRLKSRFKDRS